MRIAKIEKREDGMFEIKDSKTNEVYLTGTTLKSRRSAIDVLRYEALNYRDAFRGYETSNGKVVYF